jgi:hypothetical protein
LAEDIDVSAISNDVNVLIDVPSDDEIKENAAEDAESQKEDVANALSVDVADALHAVNAVNVVFLADAAAVLVAIAVVFVDLEFNQSVIAVDAVDSCFRYETASVGPELLGYVNTS